jgi:hypothetical protein
VTLYSSRQDVLETRQTRFSWSISGKGDKLPVTLPSVRKITDMRANYPEWLVRSQEAAVSDLLLSSTG